MRDWIRSSDRNHFIAVTGMHGVIEAVDDKAFHDVLASADLVVPDGTPLVWLGRRRGFDLRRRVYGPELMETFCHETAGQVRHFLYGGAPGVADRLALILQDHGSTVAGTFTPPFRALTPEEEVEVVDLINGSAADVLWVGLSTPKQEKWMFNHRSELTVPVSVGVGAAFDFLSGTKSSAPNWMKENGLEWLYRLTREPGRLWRRYLVGGARFVFYVVRDELRSRRSSVTRS
jgi:N-acetylglucosaminyldiphosphoundecaprenol N-acetyl-beta-D-mannosaminyltransferase